MEERREGGRKRKKRKPCTWCWLKTTQSGKRDSSEVKGSYCSCRVWFSGQALAAHNHLDSADICTHVHACPHTHVI